ncbi:ATP-binding protein [Massilia sp. YIM B02443]|uniref:hybrid sensor histidine kinase/response regulator n=1 Tax=Massilia sp. YIM B02443 TaxID=3050127 RepID=UPI0025B6BDC9|nr:ATP-binding protein [Massilia sp. YIM B02443]MDN4039661.1 ATP-binding protein [Massilia sp. YIM B02443]
MPKGVSAAGVSSDQAAQPSGLVRHPPSGALSRGVAGALVCLALPFALVAPLAAVPLPDLPSAPPFLLVVQSSLIAANLLIAILLLGHVHAGESRALGILALGYFTTALVASAHMLAGLFIDDGPGGANLQLMPWLYLAWHALLPLFALGYARRDVRPPDYFMRGGALLALLGVALLVLALVSSVDALPPLLHGTRTLPAYRWIGGALLVLTLWALLTVVRKRPRSALDLWLAVALSAWAGEAALSCVLNAARDDLGFHAGALYGLAASLCVLGVLAVDNIGLHVRLHATFQEMVETRARAHWQSLLGTVLRQLPGGVLIVDHAGRCVMANDEAARMAERFSHAGNGSGPDVAGAGGGAGGVAAMLELIGEPVARVVKGEGFRDALLESAFDATRRVYAVSGEPLRGGAAELAAAVVVLDDITERTEAAAALARALDQTRYLIENTPLAVIEWDRDFQVTLWNRRAEELFGWRAAEVLGRRVDRLPIIDDEDATQIAQMIARLVESGTRYAKSSNRNRTRDGRSLCCEWYNSMLYDERGEILTVFSLVLDVTERVQAMEGLRDADRRKDVYIATLAHELRNPLAPIANAASLLRGSSLAPERIEWIGSMVARQAAQMARLLDDLLDVSRIGRGKITLRRTRVELGRLIRDTLQTSMPLIEAGRHQVALDLHGEPLWVDADPLRLTQVLANLINNAAKYTPPGGIIEIGLRLDDGRACVTVRDNGVGLDPAMIERVFDPFVQVSSASHMAQGGLGIGLSLAKGLVELHGGSIAAASAGAGQGALFTVRLPLGAAPEAPDPGEAAQAGAAALGQHILVADDNVDAAESLAWLLRAEGASVTVAHDGAQALRLYNQQPARIALLDLGMPGMDGLEVAAILARKAPRPYMVAVTGRGRQEDRAASLAAGFDEHLTKPVAPQQLIALLRQLVDGPAD